MLSKNLITSKGHVTTGKRVGKKLVAVKARQAERFHHQKQIITDVMSPSPNELALTNGTQIKYFLKSDAVRTIDSTSLRLRIRMDGGDGVLAPVPYWFDRIEIYERHSGVLLFRAYGDALFLLLNIVEQNHIEQWASLTNYDPNTYNKSLKTHSDGETRDYYLPLVASMFEGMHLDMGTITSDLEFRLHPASGGPLISGAGTPKLLEVAGVYEIDHEDDSSQHAHASFLKGHVPIHYYLDIQQYVEVGRIMNNSTRYEFDLDQFNHLSAGLVAVIRRTGAANVDNGNQKYIDLYDGSLDVTNSTGKSIYGGGREVPADYLRNIIAPKYVNSQYFGQVAMYPIIFGDLNKALAGSVHGSHKFNGDKQRLVINTPPSAGVAANVVITQSAAADAGTATISYKGSQVQVDFNAPANSIGVGVTRMQSFEREGLVATAVEDFSNANNVVITITKASGQPVYLESPITVSSNLTNAGSPVGLASVWTPGSNGWVSGVSYDVTIYSLYFRSVHQENGRLETNELV